MFATCAASLFCSCASVRMQSAEKDAYAKEFNPPPQGYCGLYLYRKTALGCAIKRKLYVDGQYIGKTAFKTYFYRFVRPGGHVLQTESEWGPEELHLDTKEGQNYFVLQDILFGVFSARASLSTQITSVGKSDIGPLRLAADMDDKSKDLKDADYGEGKGSLPAARLIGAKHFNAPAQKEPEATTEEMAPKSANNPISTADSSRIARIKELHRGGIISDEEYEQLLSTKDKEQQ